MKKINFKTYFKNKKDRISFFGISPTFDWRFMLSIFMLIILCGVVYASTLYMNIMNESLFNSVEEQAPVDQTKKKQKEIDQVIEKIQIRNFDEMTES